MFLTPIRSGNLLIILCMICATLQYIEASKLPVWVKSCPKAGPLSLDDCIVKRIRDAMPYISHGYPKYRIPSLEPLRITSIEVGSGSGGKQIGLSLKMANIEIWGIQNANFYKSKIDIPNRTLELLWSSSRVEILGDYIMDGKVLVLPIKSDGPGNITLIDASGDYKMTWDYYEKSDKRHSRITSSSMDFKIGRAFFHFKNLFNGDKTLGSQMNSFLNENWSEVVREFGPAVGDALNRVFRQLIQNGFDLVPFDSFFLDK